MNALRKERKLRKCYEKNGWSVKAISKSQLRSPGQNLKDTLHVDVTQYRKVTVSTVPVPHVTDSEGKIRRREIGQRIIEQITAGCVR